MLKIKRLNSFGIIEALVASLVIILILTGAIALTTNLVKSSTIDESYQEAEGIAEEIFSNIETSRSTGEIYFVTADSEGVKYPVECFDNDFVNGSSSLRTSCFDSSNQYRNLLPFRTLSTMTNYSADQFDANNFYSVSQPRSVSVSPGYFKFKVQVLSDGCLGVSGVSVPSEKCRKVVVEIKWEDKNGQEVYRSVERFSDWQN